MQKPRDGAAPEISDSRPHAPIVTAAMRSAPRKLLMRSAATFAGGFFQIVFVLPLLSAAISLVGDRIDRQAVG